MRHISAVLVAVGAAIATVAGPTVAWAAGGTPVCDSYSQTCTTSSGAPVTSAQKPTASGGASLPFTGADVVLLGAVGAGAIGTGALLVAAGRRRRAGSR